MGDEAQMKGMLRDDLHVKIKGKSKYERLETEEIKIDRWCSFFLQLFLFLKFGCLILSACTKSKL